MRTPSRVCIVHGDGEKGCCEVQETEKVGLSMLELYALVVVVCDVSIEVNGQTPVSGMGMTGCP